MEASLKPAHRNMTYVEGGTFRMGSDEHYLEEAPAHRVTVDGFWIDSTPVTNRQFEEFVRETGHITFAETKPNPTDYPDALPELLFAGSLVFVQPRYPVSLHDWSQWWSLMKGADWRHPYGPKSSIKGLDDHPVVHITYADAQAYATWASKELPTEAEWEYAARGGLDGAPYAWGHEFMPDGRMMANTWAGTFPHERKTPHKRTSPVKSYPPNGYGLYDMTGNVWEWTTDWWSSHHTADAANACCISQNPRGGPQEASFDPAMPESKIPRKVIKGGSHLCAPNYCRRYRPAARHAEPIDTSTSHLGFRCIIRERKPDHD